MQNILKAQKIALKYTQLKNSGKKMSKFFDASSYQKKSKNSKEIIKNFNLKNYNKLYQKMKHIHRKSQPVMRKRKSPKKLQRK